MPINYKKIFVLITIISMSCAVIDDHQAKSLAQKSLEDYCLEKNIACQSFGAPKISKSNGCPWMFDYQSQTTPKHSVVICVYTNGDVERHHMIDE